jgi:hypothetical protein
VLLMEVVVMEMEAEQQEPQQGRLPVETERIAALHDLQEDGEVVPGAPVIRSNTPRPMSFERVITTGSMMGQAGLHFPAKAPSAPPLPEELNEGSFPPLRLSEQSPVEEAQEFAWLFEYGLEMDPNVLNSGDRLNGLAMLYGPAQLRGYQLLCGSVAMGPESQPLATIVPVDDPGSIVWGVLYRIPRRLLDYTESGATVLDLAHHPASMQAAFKQQLLTVRESYRDREISCVTYVANEQTLQRASLISPTQAATQPLVQHIARLARQQKLPDSYLNVLPPPSKMGTIPDTGFVSLPLSLITQETEPLPIVKEASTDVAPVRSVTRETETSRPSRWLVILAIYLILMLLTALALAILQGSGAVAVPAYNGLQLFGVPWLIVMYGFLGGCLSCLLSLAGYRRTRLPTFVALTWFARPFIAGILALISYHILTSGAFVLNAQNPQQHPIFLLIGVLAGVCENRLFVRAR